MRPEFTDVSYWENLLAQLGWGVVLVVSGGTLTYMLMSLHHGPQGGGGAQSPEPPGHGDSDDPRLAPYQEWVETHFNDE